MTKSEIFILDNMRSKGKTASEIALVLRLSVNTVRSYIRRHPIKTADESICRHCGKTVPQRNGYKTKLFCSDKCRNAWWREHPDKINKKAYYTFICRYCGKEFESYGNQTRKYCSRECYGNARKIHALSDTCSTH